MNMDAFTINLVLIGFPGVITYQLLKRLLPRRERSALDVFFLVTVYAVLSYTLLGLLLATLNDVFGYRFEANYLKKFQDGDDFELSELVMATCAAVGLALTLSALETFNVWSHLAQKLKVSNRFGDSDTWAYFHAESFSQGEDRWVYVRDTEKDLIYFGAIKAWSDGPTLRELVLEQVDVYSNNSEVSDEILYSVPRVYLAKAPTSISVEIVPKTEDNLIDER